MMGFIFNRYTNIPRRLSKICLLIVVLINTACASLEGEEQGQLLSQGAPSPLGNVEYHTALLAQELFAGVQGSKQYRYAVAGFVPVDSLKYNPNEQGPLMMLGHQLEQGMVTEAARRGLITQDYKTTNDIIISDMSDRVFSRNVEHLDGGQSVDFFISGTITQQQEGAVVNARIIHVQTKDVVAAATKFFPAGLFWQREKVTTRNGMIYRTGSD